jgi:hypothetical protein
MIAAIIIFRVFGIFATVMGVVCFSTASNPLALAAKGANPALFEIEAFLAFIIATICLVGAEILSALRQIAALLKSPSSP